MNSRFKRLFTRCDLYHRTLLYYYAETKEIIYESVNLKEFMYSQLIALCEQAIRFCSGRSEETARKLYAFRSSVLFPK